MLKNLIVMSVHINISGLIICSQGSPFTGFCLLFATRSQQYCWQLLVISVDAGCFGMQLSISSNDGCTLCILVFLRKRNGSPPTEQFLALTISMMSSSHKSHTSGVNPSKNWSIFFLERLDPLNKIYH